MALDHYFRRVMSGRATGALPAVLRVLGEAAEPWYAGVIRARNHGYDSGRLRVHRLGRPTISVGNLSAGGTGKTPVVAHLATTLKALGHQPAILLRGYRKPAGEDARSDEELELLALTNHVVPVAANKSRVAGAAAILAAHPATTCFILDDGFQHRRVARDLDIVLVSATQGVSGGRVLPRGLLREPVEGLGRADVVIVTRVDQVLAHERAGLERELRGYLRSEPTPPIFRCRHAVLDVVDGAGVRLSDGVLSEQRLFAVTGTGDPAAFTQTLTAQGLQVVGQKYYRDHHPYTPRDLELCTRAARAAGATALITTGKDAVKLLPLSQADASAEALPLLTLRIHPTFEPGEAEALTRVVEGAICG